VSWVLAFAGFAALIILHEAGHFTAAKAVGMRVERFMLFFPPIVAKVRRGETEYGIGAVPLGGYVKITGMTPHEDLTPEVAPRAYLNMPVWKRVVVIAAGPFVNIVIAFLIIWALFVANGIGHVALQVDDVSKGSPAAAALRPGDRVVSVDGVAGYAPGLGFDEADRRSDALRTRIASHTCAGTPSEGCRAATPATVVVERDGRRLTERIAPRYVPGPNGTKGTMLLGLTYGTRGEPVGPVRAAGLTVTGMWDVTRTTATRIVQVFYDPQKRKEVNGVVGSYETTRQSFSLSTARALEILALISLSLAVVNLFPFLPLDGGHIFWALAEKVRGRPIPFRIVERASVVGFLLVAFLFVVGLSNDIGTLSGQGFGVSR
jgi:regulator of sigma E protease